MRMIPRLFVIVASLALVSCATQDAKREQNARPDTSKRPSYPEAGSLSGGARVPPPSRQKGSKTLKLVRVMEGGACKDDDQGAKGVFLVYSDPEDIERIKDEKGKQIFADFERKIQGFSLVAFDRVVKASEIAVDPFALDIDDAQSKVATKLIKKFAETIQIDIEKFEQATTLTIDVVPFAPSFEFYVNDCEATHTHSDP